MSRIAILPSDFTVIHLYKEKNDALQRNNISRAEVQVQDSFSDKTLTLGQ